MTKAIVANTLITAVDPNPVTQHLTAISSSPVDLHRIDNTAPPKIGPCQVYPIVTQSKSLK